MDVRTVYTYMLSLIRWCYSGHYFYSNLHTLEFAFIDLKLTPVPHNPYDINYSVLSDMAKSLNQTY